MPSYNCKHGTCMTLLAQPGYCQSHAHHAPQRNPERDRIYDREKRDKEAARFYSSLNWQTTRRHKLAMTPVCERCRAHFATEVHHLVGVTESVELRTEMMNLMACCHRCHMQIEAQKRRERGDGGECSS